MLAVAELRTIAQARLEDAEVLRQSGRQDGAVYLCGYAVEMALKAKIGETLNWEGYPSTNSEFQNYQSFRTHNLEVLLRLSGAEAPVRLANLPDWSRVSEWDPEMRYDLIGTTSDDDARLMIESTGAILRIL